MGLINLYNKEDMKEFLKEVRREKAIGKDRLGIKGHYHFWHKRDDKCIWENDGGNIVPNEGLNYIWDILFNDTSVPSAWYMGLYKSNATLGGTDTASSKLGDPSNGYQECTISTYYDDPSTRATYVPNAAASSGTISNSSSKCEFTMNSSFTVYGAFLTTTSGKTDKSGKLLSAKAINSSSGRSVIADDILTIQYDLTATST
jgi:hypothetical protein